MSKTPEWQIYLKEQLRGNGYSRAVLNCDGDKITFEEYIYKRRVSIQWYYNGIWKGEYHNVENEIGKKFGTPMYIKTSPRVVKLARMTYGEKAAEKIKNTRNLIGYNYKYTSVAAIIRQLKATCKVIEVWSESKVIESPEDIQL